MDLLIVDGDTDLLSANLADIATVACMPSGSSEVASIDSTLSLVDMNCSILKVSPQEGSAESTKMIDNVKPGTISLLANDVNQNIEFNAEHNVNLDTQRRPYRSTEVGVSSEMVKDEEESEKADGERLSSSLTFTNNSQKRKPGVILLGRGNSFSLGRSEVMLLHANRRNKSDAGRIGNRNYRHSVANFDYNKNNNNDVQALINRNLNMCDPLVAARAQTVPDSRFTPGELETLWQKAEVVMAAKQTVVQEVLEEFGIAEPGRVGEETVDTLMEETIWQAVQAGRVGEETVDTLMEETIWQAGRVGEETVDTLMEETIWQAVQDSLHI